MKSKSRQVLIPRGYEVVGRLGVGGFGTVYRALQTSLGREVALKMHHPDAGPMALQRFVREAQVLAKLNHPRILRLLDFGTCGELGFLVTDIVDAGSFRKVLNAEGPLPMKRAVEVVLQLLEVLTYIHAQGVVHRDIKPDNLLVAKDGSIRVADFGMALVDGATALSGTGCALGTAHYMAPEVFLQYGYSPATDLYATAVVLFELLTGRVPTAGMKVDRMLKAKIQGDLVQRAASALPLPPTLEAIIERALHPKQTERFQSTAEFASALREFLEAQARRSRTGYRASMKLHSFPPPPPCNPLVRAAKDAVAGLARVASLLWAAPLSAPCPASRSTGS